MDGNRCKLALRSFSFSSFVGESPTIGVIIPAPDEVITVVVLTIVATLSAALHDIFVRTPIILTFLVRGCVALLEEGASMYVPFTVAVGEFPSEVGAVCA